MSGPMCAYADETIAAVATPAGVGAIAVVRMSGRLALDVAARVLVRRDALRPVERLRDSHRARIARIWDPETHQILDEVLVLPMLAPRSATGEDVVEIHCHGGPLVSDLILRALLRAGARAARPGEFTERAFLNGRIDLCQAEAVADLITARSEAGLDAARLQLEGRLSQTIASLRERIVEARALTEAYLDFSDEDLPESERAELLDAIASLRHDARELGSSYRRGRLAREGLRIALAGKPNVGKSSLLNTLLGRERALVSSVPGTTRDYLEEPLAIGQLGALLCDTAGLRCTVDPVEQAGVTRAAERIREADVILVVLDGSVALDADDRLALQPASGGPPRIVLRNKADLPAVWTWPEAESFFGIGSGRDEASREAECSDSAGRQSRLPAASRRDPVAASLDVSAKTGEGITELCRAIQSTILPAAETSCAERPSITRARHESALGRAVELLEGAERRIREWAELDLAAIDLRSATLALDALLGTIHEEEVLDAIFRRFCVGK